MIISKNNELIQRLAKLKDTKNIKEGKRFIVEGEHLVLEAYNANLLELVLSVDDKRYKDIETIQVSSEVIKRLSSTTTPQGIIGVVKVKEATDLKGDVIILDDLKDPGNLGTIMRTAVAFGITKIYASNSSVYVYNDKVVRASQGAIFKVDVEYCDIVKEIQKLKDLGYHILASSLKAKKSLEEVKGLHPFALVIGNEANGISDIVLSESTEEFIIPMSGDMESLNASVACAICMYVLTH